METADNFNDKLHQVLKDIVVNHKRIIFNGNGYCQEWIDEAEKRGLPNIPSTVEAIPALISEKAKKVFGKHNVFSEVELHSRYEIFLEAYIKQINIEALTMIEMAKTQLLPAAIKYIGELAYSYNQVNNTGFDIDKGALEELLNEVSISIRDFKKAIKELERAHGYAVNLNTESYTKAEYYKNEVIRTMNELRFHGDRLEQIVDADLWPIPTYGEMLFNI